MTPLAQIVELLPHLTCAECEAVLMSLIPRLDTEQRGRLRAILIQAGMHAPQDRSRLGTNVIGGKVDK